MTDLRGMPDSNYWYQEPKQQVRWRRFIGALRKKIAASRKAATEVS